MIKVILVCLFTILKGEYRGRVIRVIDGDTFICLIGTEKANCRISAIDAPELSQKSGYAAKKYLEFLIYGKEIKISILGNDRYGRYLVNAFHDSISISGAMLSRGLAWHYHQYDKSLVLDSIEKIAKLSKIGLWWEARPMPPWEWRHALKRK